MESLAFAIVMAVLVGIPLFLICRELFTWYWKLNAIVDLLTEIRNELKGRKVEEPAHAQTK